MNCTRNGLVNNGWYTQEDIAHLVSVICVYFLLSKYAGSRMCCGVLRSVCSVVCVVCSVLWGVAFIGF